MLFNYLRDLKANTDTNTFKNIMEVVTKDVKFNRIEFGKRTTAKQFIEICETARKVAKAAHEGEYYNYL